MKKLLLILAILIIFKISHEHNGNMDKFKAKQVEHLSVSPLLINTNKYLGLRYNWGSQDIANGVDCSLFTQLVYKDNGIDIPRGSKEQSKEGTEVKIENIKKGDLLFFSKRHDLNEIGHVSLYIGNNRIIHAVSRGVVIDSIGDRLWESYWEKRLLNIKRIPRENS